MSAQREVGIKVEAGVTVPGYASEYAAGADVRAYLSQEIVILPGCSARIPTGIRFEIPKGFEIQVRPRSGLAANYQVTVLNTPGTIDADYRGELQIILMNHGKEAFIVTNDMRIAQIVLAPVVQANFVQVETLADTARGTGGFGHTGTH